VLRLQPDDVGVDGCCHAGMLEATRQIEHSRTRRRVIIVTMADSEYRTAAQYEVGAGCKACATPPNTFAAPDRRIAP